MDSVTMNQKQVLMNVTDFTGRQSDSLSSVQARNKKLTVVLTLKLIRADNLV
jgi:hypothetical protein